MSEEAAPAKNKGGRPRLHGRKRAHLFQFWLNDSELAVVNQAAEESGRTRAAYARECVLLIARQALRSQLEEREEKEAKE